MKTFFTEDWEKLDTWAKRFLTLLVWTSLPALFLLMLDPNGHLSLGWLIFVGVWLYWQLVKWAAKTDREERSQRQFEKSFSSELGELDAQVRASMPHTPRPKVPRVQFRNSEGEPMLCIICGEYTNRGGRFCDVHDG